MKKFLTNVLIILGVVFTLSSCSDSLILTDNQSNFSVSVINSLYEFNSALNEESCVAGSILIRNWDDQNDYLLHFNENKGRYEIFGVYEKRIISDGVIFIIAWVLFILFIVIGITVSD